MIFTYKDIDGYLGYKVGDNGAVQSCWQQNGRNPRFLDESKWIDLKPTAGGAGYLFVGLHRDQKSRLFSVHRLVLTAFIGPAPLGYVGCHNDGNKLNNKLSNLRWDTQKNNLADRYKHGTVRQGMKAGRSHLTDEMVVSIRAARSRGTIVRVLAEQYRVSVPTIKDIVQFRTWRHV